MYKMHAIVNVQYVGKIGLLNRTIIKPILIHIKG